MYINSWFECTIRKKHCSVLKITFVCVFSPSPRSSIAINYVPLMPKLIATTHEGRLQGRKLLNYEQEVFLGFFGIPYAEPPIGELRFRAPVPKKPWTGVRSAVKEGPPCPCKHMIFQYYVGKESECLNLNVYTKSLPSKDSSSSSSLKPVMVWIHGGAFFTGSNTAKVYGPQYLMTEDIVLVAINYRLGVLGFLSLEDPKLGVPGNAGLKDMVLALKWVQRNIQRFNGDPENVTIFGESAGSAAVHYLCLSPVTKGLFHKAIAQSGCALNCWATGCRNGRLLANILGYKEEDEANILKRLRAEPAKRLVKAQHKVVMYMNADGILPFSPVVEQSSKEPAFLLEQPIEILRKGTFHDVPLIMGYNSEEGIMYHIILKLFKKARGQKNLECDIPHNLNFEKGSKRSVGLANRIKEFYLNGEEPCSSNLKRLISLKTDTQFVHGIHRTLAYHKLKGTSPVFLYRMSLETSINNMKRISTVKFFYLYMQSLFYMYKCPCCLSRIWYKLLIKTIPRIKVDGACHGDELSYLFKFFADPKLKPCSLEEISMKRFVQMWTNFAKTGNPTPFKTDLVNVQWWPVPEDMDYCLEIGRDLKMDANPDLERMQFWDSIYKE